VSLKAASRTDAVVQKWKSVIGVPAVPLIGAQGSLVHTLPGEPDSAAFHFAMENRWLFVRDLTLFPRPAPLSGDILGWLNTFALTFLTSISSNDQSAFLRRVRERLSQSIQDASGKWTADYVRLRFYATRG
jgi:hypothetical protein